MRKQTVCLDLYNACFPVEPDFTRVLFHTFGQRCLHTVQSNGQTVGMAFALPVHLEEKRGIYVYALCVHPDFRGQGHMRALLEQIENAYGPTADFLCLVPASGSLWETYARHGYAHVFYAPGYTEPTGPLQEVTDAAQIGDLRRTYGISLVEYSPDYLQTVGQYCRFFTDARGYLITQDTDGPFFECLGPTTQPADRVAAVKWLTEPLTKKTIFSYPMA